jgi:hypothetical protein
VDEFLMLQERLASAWQANLPGSTTSHVVVAMPSFSLGETILSHYATRIPALEHRYLLSSLMLRRIPGCELVFLASACPEPEVLDYYTRWWSDEVAGRFHLLEVPDGSARPIAAKVLEHPDLLEHIRQIVGDRPAFIEPWNVTEREVALAVALGIPINGTSPELWPLGFKSEGRRIFARAGVPVAIGREDVHDVDDVAAAIAYIRKRHPHAAGVVVKHDNSGAGDGNFVIRLDAADVHEQLATIPAWYVHDLSAGGIVEELVTGAGFSSPSVQLDITPYGEVVVLSTHEQLLGGPHDQVYEGCRFPADRAYAADLARHGRAVGEELARLGVLGRVAVDFVAVRRGAHWELFALEINLRKGGTTHPFTTLRHLVPGRYDEADGVWVASEDGTPRYYRSTDNLMHETWLGLPPARVIDAVDRAGLAFDAAAGTGVVLHMLACLAIDGRLGLTAVGRTPGESAWFYEQAREAVTASAEAS